MVNEAWETLDRGGIGGRLDKPRYGRAWCRKGTRNVAAADGDEKAEDDSGSPSSGVGVWQEVSWMLSNQINSIETPSAACWDRAALKEQPGKVSKLPKSGKRRRFPRGRG